MGAPATREERLLSAGETAANWWTKALVVGLLGGAVVLGVMEANSSARIPRGQPAPAFQVKRLTGETVSLGDLKGKVVVLAFWGTWCPPCREELPGLVALADQNASRGVTLLAVNDMREDAEPMAQFVARRMPNLGKYAAEGNDAILEAYQVDTFPTLYVLDPRGQVVASVNQIVREPGRVQAWVDEALKRN